MYQALHITDVTYFFGWAVPLEGSNRPRGINLITMLGRREKDLGSAVRTDLNEPLVGLRARSQYRKMSGSMNRLPVWRAANGRHPNHSDRLSMQARKHLCRTMVSVLPDGLLGNRLGLGQRIRNSALIVVPRSCT